MEPWRAQLCAAEIATKPCARSLNPSLQLWLCPKWARPPSLNYCASRRINPRPPAHTCHWSQITWRQNDFYYRWGILLRKYLGLRPESVSRFTSTYIRIPKREYITYPMLGGWHCVNTTLKSASCLTASVHGCLIHSISENWICAKERGSVTGR